MICAKLVGAKNPRRTDHCQLARSLPLRRHHGSRQDQAEQVAPQNSLPSAARKVLRFLKETPTLAELWDVRGFRYDFNEV